MYKDKEGLLSEKALISKEGNTISSAVWLVLEKTRLRVITRCICMRKRKTRCGKKKNYVSKHLRRKRRRRSLKGMKNLAVRR